MKASFIGFLSILLVPIISYSQSKPAELYEEARKQYYLANYVDAAEIIDRYLLTERNTQGFYLQAMIWEAMGENIRAISSLTNALSIDGDHMDAYFKRGTIFFNLGNYHQAIDDFTTLLNYGGNGVTNAVYFKLDPMGQEQVEVSSLESMKGQVYALRGLAQQAIGDHDKAEKDLNKAINSDSTAQYFVNRGLYYKEIGRKSLALNDLRMAVNIDPNLVIGWYNLMLLDPEEEIPKSVLEEDSFYPMLAYRAVEALQERDFDLSEELFTRALELKPEDPLMLLNMGRLKYNTGDFSASIEFFKYAISKDPSRFESYYLMGNAYFQLEEYTQAAAYYELYLVRDKSNENIWYNAALVYFELDDIERGCECLERALSRGLIISPTSSLLENCR